MELAVVVALVGWLVIIILPQALSQTGALRTSLASQEVASILYASRVAAIRRGHHVAVQFQFEDGQPVHFQQFIDGDGDGVLTADIDDGVDLPLAPARALRHLGRGVGFGFPSEDPPRDPGDPSRWLDRLEDPVRFNNSDLASFSPLGQATSGSVYLTDGREELRVVRLLGTSGRIRILRYDASSERWF